MGYRFPPSAGDEAARDAGVGLDTVSTEGEAGLRPGAAPYGLANAPQPFYMAPLAKR